MIRCAFCRHRAAGVFAATVLEGPREDEDSWRRGLAPMCKPCQHVLGKAGPEGQQLKGSEQRWWLGPGIGKVGGQKAGPGSTLDGLGVLPDY